MHRLQLPVLETEKSSSRQHVRMLLVEWATSSAVLVRLLSFWQVGAALFLQLLSVIEKTEFYLVRLTAEYSEKQVRVAEAGR